MSAKPDLWHTPHPGPWPSWDWRCRVCSEPVDDHPNLIRRLIHHWRNR